MNNRLTILIGGLLAALFIVAAVAVSWRIERRLDFAAVELAKCSSGVRKLQQSINEIGAKQRFHDRQLDGMIDSLVKIESQLGENSALANLAGPTTIPEKIGDLRLKVDRLGEEQKRVADALQTVISKFETVEGAIDQLKTDSTELRIKLRAY